MDILRPDSPESNPEKRCTKCRKVFPATPEFFQRNRAVKDGLRPDCKECRSKERVGSEVIRARNNAYFANPENRARALAQRKAAYHENPERRQKALDYNKRPEVRAYQRDYLKKYNKTSKGKLSRRASKHTYRARQKSVVGIHTTAQIQDLLKRQKHMCYYCGKKFEKRNGEYVYNIEHTFPISRMAGTDVPVNDISYVVLACFSCNRDKGNKFPWEFPEGGRLL